MSKDFKERVEKLISKMTIQEKLSQLIQFFPRDAYNRENGKIIYKQEYIDKISENGLGFLYGVLRADTVAGVEEKNTLSTEEGVSLINRLQKCAVEKSRLGIPLIFCEELTHGHMGYGATVYPVALAIGSTWNKELYGEICKAIGKEARSKGITLTYSPVLDILRDFRWGRAEECFSEDVYFCTTMGEIAVTALQGKQLCDKGSVVAAIKHFIVHGVPESGLNTAMASVGERQLREVWLEPFKRCVEAGARAVITSYNEVDGIPNCCNKHLIKNILKGEFGFDGFVFSDLGAVELLTNLYYLAENHKEGVYLSFDAGIDIDMLGEAYYQYLGELVEEGKIPIEEIDQAVRKVLMVKAELGLFENPYADENEAAKYARCQEFRNLSLQAAKESVILLENKKQTLPLKKACKVAVIGPNADNIYNQLGDYTAWQNRKDVITVLDGIREIVGEDQVVYAKGCDIRNDDKSGFKEALNAAEEADIIVAVIGGSSSRFSTTDSVDTTTGQGKVVDARVSDMDCGEGVDKADLTLSGVQLELLKELKKTGKKLIVVGICGRPVSEPWIKENVDAFLLSFYPGEQGGRAIGQIIFGMESPSGKLSVTIPKHVGQMPMYYCKRPCIHRASGYADMDAMPLYEFGYGLSYSSFAYSNLVLDKTQCGTNETVTICVDITNVGDMEASETVQLYIHDRKATVTRPEKELKGFEKIRLKQGETKKVFFTLGFEELKVLGADMKFRIEPGFFDVYIGASSEDIRLQDHFEMTEDDVQE